MIIDHSIYEEVRCVKDGKLYAYKLSEHQEMLDDYNQIKCFQVNESGEMSQNEILIYRKDLLRIESKRQVA
jgi:hypothetical protein